MTNVDEFWFEDEADEDEGEFWSRKPSYVETSKSIVKSGHLKVFQQRMGYFEEIRSWFDWVGEDLTPQPREDEVVMFKNFFLAHPDGD